MRLHYLTPIMTFVVCATLGCATRRADETEQVSMATDIVPFAILVAAPLFEGDPVIEFDESDMEDIMVDTSDPHYSRETLIPFLRGVLAKHGLSLVQKAGEENNFLVTGDQ